MKTAIATPPSVALVGDVVVTRYGSTVDRESDESIEIRDVVQLVLERVVYPDGPTVHWFLRHHEGWTLHFNDEFEGAEQVIPALQARLGFSLPPIERIAGAGGPGTIVWSTRDDDSR